MTDYDSLEDIPGIGSEIADNLQAAGFETPEDVLAADADELADVELIGDSSAKAILNEETSGNRGKGSTVDEHIDEIIEHARKPISHRGVFRQAPICRSTHQEWMKKAEDGREPYATYKQRYEEARAEAEEQLVEDGLYGGADSSLVKFLLKATHDYDDKQTVEHEGDGMGPVHVSFTEDDE
jgi:NAD-dependent DNA ligase